jgi:LysR family transcriptional regulator, glycine cleavage system transcriptional activator
MVRRYYDLPSLKALAVFEAAARHRSFGKAADELNVTVGAVSHQVKAIETELGVSLFHREAVGVELTAAGEDLYAGVASSFSRLSEIVQTVRRRDRSLNVTMACTHAFAVMWLMPRMTDFWNRYPDVAVHHLISDDARDYRRAEVELSIRYGSGVWADETAEFLFNDTIYPVCGPEFASRYPSAKAADLGKLPLLQHEWADPDWLDWDEILGRAGIPHPTSHGRRRFGGYYVTLIAAQANQGVAAGWEQLVRPLIEQGKLVKFTDLVLPAPGAYYLTWNNNRSLSSAAKTLREWIIDVSPHVSANSGMPV